MQATVSRNQGVVGKWTDGLSRETGQAVVRDLLHFEGFRSHGNWMRRPGSMVAWLKDDRSAEGHRWQVIPREHVVPSPGPSARTPRPANALAREFHRRGSIQSTRRGVAARVGKR